MKSTRLLLAISLVLMIGQPVLAEDEAARPWKDEAELSVVNTTGNTEVFSLYFKNLLQYAVKDIMTVKWTVAALSGRTDGEKTAERYETSLRADTHLSEKAYGYLMSGWLRDRFSGFDNRLNLGPGAGWNFFTGPTHSWLAELGFNYAMEDYISENTRYFLEGRGFTRYEYAFNPSTRLLLSLEYLQDLDQTNNYKIASQTAVTAILTKALSLKVNYEARYQNRPRPAELKTTDTLFGAALVFTY